MRILVILCVVLVLATQVQAVSVSMQWDYTQGEMPAVGFYIYKQFGCLGSFTVVQAQSVDIKTWTDTDVVLGGTYCWTVTAVAAGGEESTSSNVLRFHVSQPAPAQNLRGQIIP